MKYLIMVQGNQDAYDAMGGQSASGNTWTQDELTTMYNYMEALNNELADSGEFVDGQGLAEPKRARLVSSKNGVPVVSDGPYGESKEVVVGYWLVDVKNEDRAIEIAARAYECPVPSWAVDQPPLVVIPVQEGPEF